MPTCITFHDSHSTRKVECKAKSCGISKERFKHVELQRSFIVGCRTDGPVILVGAWFGPDLQMEKNWAEIKSRVVAFPQRGPGGNYPENV